MSSGIAAVLMSKSHTRATAGRPQRSRVYGLVRVACAGLETAAICVAASVKFGCAE